MATKNVVVVGEQNKSIGGKLLEFHRQVCQPSGYPFDPDELEKFLQRGIEGKFGVEITYANERVSPVLTYPKSFRHRSPAEQLEYLRAQRFVDGGGNQVILEHRHVGDLVKRIEDAGLPVGMENIGIWPKYSRLGGLYLATKQIFALLDGSRSFNNYRGEEILRQEHWRHTINTAGCLERLDRYQPGDYLVAPIQFGQFWAGASIRHAQLRYAPLEFGLCPYTGGCLLLTHPDRITGDGQLYMDLGGCEWSPGAVGDFYCSATFHWLVGGLGFGRRAVGYASPRFGLASGSVLQC